MIEDEIAAAAKNRRGVPSIEEFSRYMENVLGVSKRDGEEGESFAGRLERRFPGRLALAHPRTGEIEDLAALPGAIPRAWSPDGSTFASGDAGGDIVIWRKEELLP